MACRMHLPWALTKGGCEGQEVKQSEAPELRLDEQGFVSLLRNRRQSIPARILMISCPSQRDYVSRLLSGRTDQRTDQSYCPDTESQKEQAAATTTCLRIPQR